MEYLESTIKKLEQEHWLSDDEFRQLILCDDPQYNELLRRTAEAVRKKTYGNRVFIRGLIEFTNYCKNDCYYCGIRCGNKKAERYRLTREQILECCDRGYELGFRTFVLQGGEDGYFTDERLCQIVRRIKEQHPDCAVTLSVGERSRESYERLFAAGADRFLLRHETANEEHYGKLHPEELTLAHRLACLQELKEIGYQFGCGFMVGSPFQTIDDLLMDLKLIHELQPDMIGIGPFIPHRDTPFADKEAGSVQLTLKLLSILRLMMPQVLLPATTALGTLSGDGREAGILAGGNVVMPNLSPEEVRGKYLLYDNKLSSGSEAAEALELLKEKMRAIGYEVVVDRGDSPGNSK